jgi:predicted transcriptional regulator
MNKHGFTQLPVLEDGKSVGSLREGRLMSKLLDNRDLVESSVADVMEKGLPVIDEDVDLDTAIKYLKDSPALLVEEYGRIVGIITRHDVINAQF